MAHTIQLLGDAAPGWACSRTRRRKRTLTSAFGPVQEMQANGSHQTKLRPCHSKSVVRTQRQKKEASKQASIGVKYLVRRR
jgi:hypothetical protein